MAKKMPKKPSKAEELVAGVHILHDEALELAESVLFMASKLEEARKTMEKEELIIPYDNGGGQSGIRENPHFTAFEKLMATYNKSLRQLEEMIEKGSPVSNTSKYVLPFCLEIRIRTYLNLNRHWSPSSTISSAWIANHSCHGTRETPNAVQKSMKA